MNMENKIMQANAPNVLVNDKIWKWVINLMHFFFYKVKFVHLFNIQFTMTCQFKALNYNTVEFIHFSYAHFKEKEIILISTFLYN